MKVVPGGEDDAPIRVAAVDDHPAMLRGIGAVLGDDTTRVTLVATASSVAEFAAAGEACDVVLLDLLLRDGSRPSSNVRRLRELGLEVVVYTEGRQHAWLTDAVRAGARAVVLKYQPVGELLAAVEAAAAGEMFLSAETAAALQGDKALRPALPPREAEALSLVAQGLTDQQVASAMDVSLNTAKEYLKRIRHKYAKVGRPAGSRVELARWAAQDGFASGVDAALDGDENA